MVKWLVLYPFLLTTNYNSFFFTDLFVVVIPFQNKWTGTLIIENALEGHVLGSQASYYLYMLCNEDTYNQSLRNSNRLSMTVLSYLKKKVALCCAIGVPFSNVWNRCLTVGLDSSIGNWNHLVSNEFTNLGVLMMRFVTGGQSAIGTAKRTNQLDKQFAKVGNDLIREYVNDAVGLPETSNPPSASDVLIDPGLVQYNFSIIHQLVISWLEAEVLYDTQKHKSVKGIVDSAIAWKLPKTPITCSNCNLINDFLGASKSISLVRKIATRTTGSVTSCNYCAWFRNISK
jgi:hypothetical protein